MNVFRSNPFKYESHKLYFLEAKPWLPFCYYSFVATIPKYGFYSTVASNFWCFFFFFIYDMRLLFQSILCSTIVYVREDMFKRTPPLVVLTSFTWCEPFGNSSFFGLVSNRYYLLKIFP